MSATDIVNDLNMIPGASALGMGFDVFGKADMTSVTRRIFTHLKTDASSYTFDDTTYEVPDNTAIVPNLTHSGDSHVFKSKDEYRDFYSNASGISLTSGAFSGQFDWAYSETHDSNRSYYYALHSFRTTGWDAVLQDPSPQWIDPDFLADPDITALPSKFTSDNAELFFRVFRKYGTHFVNRITAGGKLDYNVAVDSTFSKDLTTISANLTLEYNALFASSKVESKNEWETLGQHWSDSRQVQFSSVGGDASIIGQIPTSPQFGDSDADVVTKWADGVMKNPSPVSYGLTPLSRVFSGDQADAVEKALDVYLNAMLVATGSWQCDSKSCNARTILKLNGATLVPTNAPPTPPAGFGAIQVALLDPDGLQPLMNSIYYQSSLHPEDTLYRQIMDDVNKVSAVDYICLVSAADINAGNGRDTDPSPEFLNWLASCGSKTPTWSGFMGYSLVGKTGMPQGAASESLYESSVAGVASASLPTFQQGFMSAPSSDEPKPEVPLPNDNRQQIHAQAGNGLCAVGQLEMLFPNGRTYAGTGTLIRPDWILTAGHNLYGSDTGGHVKSVTFTPGRDGASKPFGVVAGTQTIVPALYTESDAPSPLLSGGVEIDATPYLWDLGLVHLATPVKNCTPVELGAFAPSDLKQFQFLIPGYPGDKAAGTMWGGTGKLMSVDDELLFYGISTYNGQSGASLLVQAKNGGWYTAGIHVAGAAALKANFASRLTKEKVSWIVGALQSAGGR